MRPEQLLKQCDQQESFGLTKIMLTMPISGRKWKMQKHCNTPFGRGEIVSDLDGKISFWIEIEKVRSYIAKLGSPIETAGGEK